MFFNRFDICEAHYLFAALFHDGQFGEIYAKFGKLERVKFRPSPMLSEPRQLSENGREIFKYLVKKHCGVKSTVAQ